MNSKCYALFVTMLFIALGGCDASSSSRAMTSAAKHFAENQVQTVTTNGRILCDTVAERDGKITYSTEDGKRWQVSYSKRSDGTYQYGTPSEIK